MNYNKTQQFFKELIPVLEYLNSIWVGPNTYNENNIQIGCGFCDMTSGYGDGQHDHDCLVDKAKKALNAYNKIQADWTLELKDRSLEEMKEIITHEQYRQVMKILYNSVTEIIPVDLKDPLFKQVICHCQVMAGPDKRPLMKNKEHSTHCPFVNLSNCLKILL